MTKNVQNALSKQQTWGLPEKSGLYDPANEHDSCGIGFICDLKGRASHQIIADADHINCRMEHRGGVGYEENTGDGAGVLAGIPHKLFQNIAKKEFNTKIEPGEYGTGVFFLPQQKTQRQRATQHIEQIVHEFGQNFLGWREMPCDPSTANLGSAALAAMPYIAQIFITPADNISNSEFERQLYLIRKSAIQALRNDTTLSERKLIFVCSLSTKTIVYKGMLRPDQVFQFFGDLRNPEFETHVAMVHSRFSTNTFPSWDRAQPNRYCSHNGEINTILGNRNSMSARQGVIESELFASDIEQLFPIIEEDCSDSGSFDNVLEFLRLNGRSMQEALMMMIPEAWQQHTLMSAEKRAFYEYHSCLMEPWDGPASIAFTDGDCVGAVLDRNGLRPSRYYITDDDKCIMASEVGVLEIDPATIVEKGRLKPGRIFLIDFAQGRMIPDSELKEIVAKSRPYAEWIEQNSLSLKDFPVGETPPVINSNALYEQMRAFGFTTETLQFMLLPMIRELRDPLGSMGNDSALAVLSDKPRMLYDYFKQLFAQVTNPAIDSIREEVIMALNCYIGPERNLLDSTPEHCNRLNLEHPIISNAELSTLKKLNHNGWSSEIIDITHAKDESLDDALTRICVAAGAAIEAGHSLIILSDRNINAQRIPVSALLATGAVHQHLVACHTRTRIGIIVETGEAREVQHHCLLISYGADGINPYLAFEALFQAERDGFLSNLPHLLVNTSLANAQALLEDKIIAAYRKAVGKGIMKVMAKMGISTLQSYKGAQIFEAIGLAEDVIVRCFTGTASRVQGVDFTTLSEEMLRRHDLGYANQKIPAKNLTNPGDFHWRAGGDMHMWDPSAIAALQNAARNNDETAYWQFANKINQQNNKQATLRGLLDFQENVNGGPIDLAEVESEKSLVKRFATGAMSFGSISQESHETLAIAMNRIGGKSNTGEGGEDTNRFIPLENGDSKRSAIKQVASGRFGVTIDYLSNADELQIKIIQGAKPGEGGELPGPKVDEYIASLRHSTPGVGLISPPPHHDIYSIEDMAQLIHDLKNANPKARISVKLGAELGVGTVATGVTKARADHIVIAGDTGGTGASPLTSIKHAGIPWELGLAETHQTLVKNNLRSRVVLQTDGQLKTGRDVAIAALLGAEEFGFATAPLITLGCIMMRKCHLNTCPVGIATQDKALRKKFTGQPEHLVNYLFMVARELRGIMAQLGFKTLNDMVGRVDALKTESAEAHWKAQGLDLSLLLSPAEQPADCLGVYRIHEQNHELDKALDNKLIELAEPSLEKGQKVTFEMPILNTNRVVGGMLSNRIISRVGPQMLPEGTIHFKFFGSAGQSLGAWLAKGVTLEVEGDANDYVGKGLSGGQIVVYPPKSSKFIAEDNIIAGNVALYGATSGQVFLRGNVAERFCVRNSGASAVVEGIGDHGCEYMTGGRVVVLGKTGRNFAAGMSGGIAYVWDPDKLFKTLCNSETVDLDSVDTIENDNELHTLITQHAQVTGSTVAKAILKDWSSALQKFVKVMPKDYKRVLEEALQKKKPKQRHNVTEALEQTS
ncbi:MAG: glutamate synthase large subunit [Pseudomonadales bacterium]|nr:glutamate synthase large subunit [Pseudomonadales bacterium]